MLELADVFRRFGPEYRSKSRDSMPAAHLRAMRDIENCRTAVMGGTTYVCRDCGMPHYSFHSCKNRHCPKCQNNSAEDWLEKKEDCLLPVHYFLVTFTLPAELRQIARSNQKTLYNILFNASAGALQKLALDPKYVGGRIGMLGVLQTWARNLSYHPHVHYLVPGGGLSEEGKWLPAAEDFLVPAKALAIIFRAKFRDTLKKTELFNQVPHAVWKKNWVVDIQPAGKGMGVLKYIAPYIYRVAISNNRLVKMDNDTVTFRYKDSDTDQWRLMTLPAMEFIRRFLQHVLPKGFRKVRSYGFMSPKHKGLLEMIFTLLRPKPPKHAENTEQIIEAPRSLRCPACGGKLKLVGEFRSRNRGDPNRAGVSNAGTPQAA